MRCAAISRRQSRLGALLALAAPLALLALSCRDDHFDATCLAKDGKIDVAWNALPDAQRFSVRRTTTGSPAEFVGEVEGTVYADVEVQNGTLYDYVVRPLHADGSIGSEVAKCSAMPAAGNGDAGLAAIDDLTCRANNGRADLAWTPIDGASSYRVLRSGGGVESREVADVNEPLFADLGLVDGSIYEYSVVAVDAGGHASPQSNAATCQPVARGEGEPPPVVAAPSCRGKNDKVDVTWTPVAGAAFYRVSRVQGSDAPVVVGEVSGNVLADFGLPLDVPQQYSVASVSATGAAAAASEVCNVTPHGRADGNHAPVFTSEPLTSALESHYWWTQVVATDPDGDAIAYSLFVNPGGMESTAAGFLSWTPSATQLGPSVVEVRATDARGAYASQSFAVNVADFDEPPKITSIPVKVGEAGQPYLYDVDAFDPEGGALRFSFGAAAPAGMTIDPLSGIIAWTPGTGDTGQRSIQVRASDPAGGFDEQTYALDVFTGAVELLAPKGEFEVEVGNTLDLEIRSNQPAAKLIAYPLPRGATAARGHIVFTPADDQVGQYTIGVKALLGRVYDMERITVRVTRENHAPVLSDPGPQQVDEGGELVVPLTATDPDGDTITLLPGGALPTNALLDAVGSRLVFRPSYEQAGSVEVMIAASDGNATTTVTIPIAIADREPPVDFGELVIDRVQSPTLQPRVRISGNVVGDPSGNPEPEAFIAVSGLSPSTGRQGRTLDVAISGLNTAFAAGQTAANFGDGITVESLEVLSPTSARAHIVIAPDAALGTRVVTLSGNGNAASSIVGFAVEKGAIVFSGQLLDSFTHQPIAGARISVNGTVLEGEADAQGRFSIEGVPPGAQQIVVVTDNYAVRRLDLAFDLNADVALDEGIALDALARPFQPGGSLPRAASVASVLDRGVAGGGSPLTLEQASAIVEDTLLAVGGDQVGVLDETGAQLNPQIAGDGLFTVTAEGVRSHAQAFLSGERVTLAEIGSNLSNAFSWGPYPPDEAALTNALQRYADAAWADPGDPLNAMALVLLNDGTTLSAKPPRVSGATSFNRFQTFLLVTSILLPSVSTIEAGVEPFLVEHGVDVEAIDDRYAPFVEDAGPIATLRRGADEVLAWIGGRVQTPAAQAQEGGITLPPPNDYFNRDPFRSRSFTRLGNHAVNQFIAEATINNAMGALLAASIQATLAYSAGATGGAVGIAFATGYVTALFHGVWGAALDKLVLGFAIAAVADQLEPTPPIPERSFVDRKAKKLVIEFDPSTSDAADASNLQQQATAAQYSYELFDFNNPDSTDSKAAIVMSVASLNRSVARPNKLEFSVPLVAVQPGVHYFRIATLQYLSPTNYGLNDSRIQFPYEIQPGATPPTSILELLGGEAKPSDFFKAEYRLLETERIQIAAQLAQQRQQRFGSFLSTFEEAVDRRQFEVVSLVQLSGENRQAIEARQVEFDAHNQQTKVKSEALVKIATDVGKARGNPADFHAADSTVGQHVDRVVADTTPTTPLAAESRTKLQEISSASRDAEVALQRASSHQSASNSLRTRAELVGQKNFDLAGNPTFKYETVNAVGEIETVTRELPQNRRQARRLLLDEAKLQSAQVAPRNAERTAALDRHQTVANQFLTDQIPDRVGHEAELSRLKEKQGGIAKDLKEAELELKDARYAQANQRPAVNRKITKYLPQMKQAVNFFGFVSNAFQMHERISDIVNGLSVIYSQFSAAHRYVNVLRDVSPYSIETHPNLLMRGAVVSSEKGIEELDGSGHSVVNPLGGTLDVTYGGDGEPEESKSAGFPPEFLSIDFSGRIYAHNGNSPQRFGGRIFRFLTAGESKDAMQREFVGSINYYSTMLGYANPASPVAMTAGMIASSSGPIETLFIANVEYTDPSGVALSPPRAVLKQLPIGLMEPGGPYADPATRGHFVAKDMVADSRWRFDGPTDLVATSDSSYSRIYVSDGPSIYVVKHGFSSGPNQVIEILNQPGRRWAGLAFDLKGSPNFYFADYETGDVFYAKSDELLAAEEPGHSLDARPLVNLGPRRIYDIEIDQGQQALVGATREGFARVPMPVVVRYQPGQLRAAVSRLGREVPAVLARSFDGTLFQILPVSGFEQDRGQARVVTRRQGSSADPVVTQEDDVRLEPAGPTEIDLR